MRLPLIAVILFAALILPGYAAETDATTKNVPEKSDGTYQKKRKAEQDARLEKRKTEELARFEKNKVEELKKLDKRIPEKQAELDGMKAERACVQAAANRDELRDCRKKSRDLHRENKSEKTPAK